MHNRRTIFSAFLVGLATLALGGPAAADQEPEFTFKLHHFLGPKSIAHTQMLVPWAERIEDDSNGRIKIDIFPSMSLGGAPPQLASQVRDGVVDIVWTLNGYTPQVFPRTEVFELPGVHTNDIVATNLALRDVFDEWLADEYEGVKVIALHVHAGQGIQMRDVAVREPADIKDKRVRIPSRTGAWIIEALGATPVGMPVPDLPQALSTGAVDGALIPWEIIPPLKIEELTDYQIEGPDGERFGTATFQIAMNQDSYDSLPPDLQAVIDANSGEAFAREIGEVWQISEDVGIAAAIADGNEHIVLSEDEMAPFRAAMDPIVNRWIDEVTAKGIDGQGLLDAAHAAIAEHSDAM